MEQAALADKLLPAAVTPPPSAAVASPPSHPSYAEMITAAIVWDSLQGKEGGSSKRAIAKYIDRVYTDLPSTHSSLLTHHLNRLKNSGHLVMVKNSYQLASSAAASPAPPHTGSTPKRGPGRPPKPKEAQLISPNPAHPQDNGSQPAKKRGRPPKQQIQQVEEHQIMMAPAEVPFQTQPVSQAHPIPANGLVAQKRRPGRPPKQPKPQPQAPVVAFSQPEPGFNGVAPAGEGVLVAKRRPGRPPKYNVGGVVRPVASGTGRPRGRPKKSGLGPVSRPVGKRPRGRPPKLGGFAGVVGMVLAKRRGRPPKGSGPPKVWKPLGRPRKDAATLRKHTSEQGRANEELTRKLDLIQSRIRDAVGVIRPYVANDNAALMALQQLEELVTPNVTAPPTEPPIMAAPMTVIAPPSAASPNVGFRGAPILTAPPTGTVTAPVMTAPAPFSVTLPPMTVTAPFPGPPGIDNQPPISWMPSGEGQL